MTTAFFITGFTGIVAALAVATFATGDATGGWQVAWQWHLPTVTTVVLAGVAAAVAAGRHAGRFRLLTAARLITLAGIVVMLSGLSRGRQEPPAGRSPPPGGPRLLAVEAPPLAWPGDRIVVRVLAVGGTTDVESSGSPPTVRLLGIDSKADPARPRPPRELATATLEPGDPPGDEADDRERLLVGDLEWTAEAGVDELAVELAGTTPDRIDCRVATRPIRLLEVAELADWNARHRHRAINDDPWITATRHLRHHALASDPLPTDPTAFARYDAVILGCLEPRNLPPGFAEGLLEAAARDGIGIVWSLDGRCDLGAISRSPLGRLLPVTPTAPAIRGPASRGVAVGPAPAAGGEPWLAELLGRGQPPLADLFLPCRTQPAGDTARVLIECGGGNGSPRSEGGPWPVVIADRSDAARVVAFLGDTWRWRGDGRGAAMDQTWRAVVRHVATPRLLGQDRSDRRTHEFAGRAKRAGSGPAEWRAETKAGPQTADRLRLWNHPLLLAAVLLAATSSWWLSASGPPTTPRQGREA